MIVPKIIPKIVRQWSQICKWAASLKKLNSLIAPSKFKGADIALGWVNDGDGKVHLYDMKAIGNSAPKVRL